MIKAEIKQKFLGEINGIEIDNEDIFYTTEYLLDLLNEKYGVVFTSEFIKDLANTISIILSKYDDIYINDIESAFAISIINSESFDTLQFKIYGSDWKFTHFNENIKNGKYKLEK